MNDAIPVGCETSSSAAARVVLHPDIVMLPRLLSPEWCAELIQRGERIGYDEAPIHGRHGAVMRKDVRDNLRAILFDQALADALFAVILPHIVAHGDWVRGQRPVGLNEMFRFYRYTAGQRFDWHPDLPYVRPDGMARSRVTFLLYLDEKCAGGATEFVQDGIRVQPRMGAGLLFLHPLIHRGAPILAGEKHVLRSDVMFSALA